MCGIAGIFNIGDHTPVTRSDIERMLAPLFHRGPDGGGVYLGDGVGLGHARLSIIDLEGGWQPIHNEDKSLWVTFNGEIFNYIELRKDLEASGHTFYTNSDTEVIVHLYEEKGPKCLEYLNGQFAIALYDVKKRSLFLARDRMGIRPLFYTFHQGKFIFASEIKAIFAADPTIERAVNPNVLNEIFTFWMPTGEDTQFVGIKKLEAGYWALLNADGAFRTEQYWDIPFDPELPSSLPSEDSCVEQLRELLVDSVRLRLRADVPVGAYLSGGLDSSAITAIVSNYTDNRLKTFSVTFSDKVYDESGPQKAVVDHLGTEHRSIECSYSKIAAAFPDVVWHTESPILRTAPTPLYLLSSLVRENDFKVVLTGEGADEVFGGYDIFKEAKVRQFIAKNPDSAFRSLLMKRLYPYLALSPTKSPSYASKFFNVNARLDDCYYAHRPRWKTTGWTTKFLSSDLKARLTSDPLDAVDRKYAARLSGIDYFSAAQYTESKMLLEGYLLSSQGDRMAMANSVEGRFPFLDHRVVEFAAKLPPKYKMKALNEKSLLKKAVADLLPGAITARKKQPYMAPDILSFFGGKEVEYLDHYLSPKALEDAGLFNPKAVASLVAKCRKTGRQSFRENMAFVGILSTQILVDKFISNPVTNMSSACPTTESIRLMK